MVDLGQTNHFRFRLGAAATGGGDEPDAGVDAGPDDPDAAPRPADTPGVTATVTRTDQWPTGYCADLVVTNTSAATVTWRVTVTVDGTINNAWNSQVTQAGNQATFTGAPYNATLAPGAVAEAGFCTML
ncbi:MAG: cellulose binding domain-containing protein [Kofleriaceae bacterium]